MTGLPVPFSGVAQSARRGLPALPTQIKTLTPRENHQFLEGWGNVTSPNYSWFPFQVHLASGSYDPQKNHLPQALAGVSLQPDHKLL